MHGLMREGRYKPVLYSTTAYLANLQYYAETFERFALKGTPSQILIAKQGILRYSRFGYYSELEHDIQDLLNEPES